MFLEMSKRKWYSMFGAFHFAHLSTASTLDFAFQVTPTQEEGLVMLRDGSFNKWSVQTFFRRMTFWEDVIQVQSGHQRWECNEVELSMRQFLAQIGMK